MWIQNFECSRGLAASHARVCRRIRRCRSKCGRLLTAGFGNTEEEVNAILERNERVFFEKCRKWNLKLNKSKLKRAQSSVAFMGHFLTPEWLKPDPAKVEAILEMPPPTDVKGVKCFLEMVNYLAKFLYHCYRT